MDVEVVFMISNSVGIPLRPGASDYSVYCAWVCQYEAGTHLDCVVLTLSLRAVLGDKSEQNPEGTLPESLPGSCPSSVAS